MKLRRRQHGWQCQKRTELIQPVQMSSAPSLAVESKLTVTQAMEVGVNQLGWEQTMEL
jgi:hypothetical protein